MARGDRRGRLTSKTIWITKTALATALNTSYMAEQLAIFGLVVGIGGALKRASSTSEARRQLPVAAS